MLLRRVQGLGGHGLARHPRRGVSDATAATDANQPDKDRAVLLWLLRDLLQVGRSSVDN